MDTYAERKMHKGKDHTFSHGGDWAGFREEYGEEALDFSMNVNPAGIPPGVAKAISAAAQKADRYPDPGCRRLRKKLADREGIKEKWLFFGNGAADIIDRIALAFGATGLGSGGMAAPAAMVTAPTFSEYEEALKRCGWIVETFPLTEGDGDLPCIDEKRAPLLMEKVKGLDMLFLCEPNNPTGLSTDREILADILRACRDTETTVVIDECFNGFLDDPEAVTMRGYLEDFPNLIILKAFTKIYGMAGVRLGYCLCSDAEKLKKIESAGQPWNVSYLAEEAGLAALDENEYLESSRKIISEERSWLKKQLDDIGATRICGEANYILFSLEDKDLTLKLRKRGILIRDCSNYRGLDSGWYRIAVRRRVDNLKLVEALKEICGR